MNKTINKVFETNSMTKNPDYRLLLLLLLISISLSSFGQSKEDSLLVNKNALFIELMGSSAFVYNITYDRIVSVKGKNKVAIAIGAQLFPKLGLLEDNLVSFSPQISYLRGQKYNLELGVGLAFEIHNSQWGIPFRIGYRYQPLSKGFFFRVGFTPIITTVYPEQGSPLSFHPWAGVGMGFTFK